MFRFGTFRGKERLEFIVVKINLEYSGDTDATSVFEGNRGWTTAPAVILKRRKEADLLVVHGGKDGPVELPRRDLRPVHLQHRHLGLPEPDLLRRRRRRTPTLATRARERKEVSGMQGTGTIRATQ